jgi:hypothetical protein
MRCAYLSTDEANNALALEWAAACGIELFPLAPKDGLPPHPTHSPSGRVGRVRGLPGREYDAVLCDWDFWPGEVRRELLADLSNGPPPCPLAVHGYNLDEDTTMHLRNQGVDVHRSLHLDVFRRLRLARRQVRITATWLLDSEVASEGNQEEFGGRDCKEFPCRVESATKHRSVFR